MKRFSCDLCVTRDENSLVVCSCHSNKFCYSWCLVCILVVEVYRRYGSVCKWLNDNRYKFRGSIVFCSNSVELLCMPFCMGEYVRVSKAYLLYCVSMYCVLTSFKITMLWNSFNLWALKKLHLSAE